MYCYKHEKVEATLSCGRCDRPICTRCSVHTDVGIRCKVCAPTGMRPKMVRTGGSVLGGAIILILVIVAATSLFDLGGANNDFGDYYGDTLDDYDGRVSVSQWLDPWESDDGGQPAVAGNRLIAAEVTIENDTDAFPVYATSTSFKITDSEGFVFQTTTSRVQPTLAESLLLNPGEKTRGWVMFEVPEDAVIERLQYWMSDVPLPGDS